MAYEIVVPRLGWSMEEGTFAGWLKHEGDFVRRGDALFSLEGEKAIQEIEALDEGILHIPPNGPNVGTVIKVGAIVGYLVEEGEKVPALDKPVAKSSQRSTTLPPVASPSVRRRAREIGVELKSIVGSGRGGRITTEDVQRSQAVAKTSPSSSASKDMPPATSIFASPRARRVARELGVDWRRLRGSGTNGRVRERDVRAVAEKPTWAGVREPITNRRRVIADRLMASRQQTVPVTLTTRADATNLVNIRERFKAVEGLAVIPSYQDILVKLAAEVIGRHLQIASKWHHDAIVVPRAHEVHIGIAVDTDDGLLVPVIHSVNDLTIHALAEQARILIERARSGKLAANEMQGSVFTITNLGAFGIDAFTPVINLPECAILGLGAIRLEPFVLPNGGIVARHQITLSLTFDHRVIDGAPAARFLHELVTVIASTM